MIKITINKNGPIIEHNSVQAKKKNGQKPKGRDNCLCHKCDKINGPCVNPDHLFLGTHKDNTQDCLKKDRFNAGCTLEGGKKGVETRRIRGTQSRAGGCNSESAKKAWKTRAKNGRANFLSFDFQSEMSKRAWDKRKKDPDLHKKCVENVKKGWETRRRNQELKNMRKNNE